MRLSCLYIYELNLKEILSCSHMHATLFECMLMSHTYGYSHACAQQHCACLKHLRMYEIELELEEEEIAWCPNMILLRYV